MQNSFRLPYVSITFDFRLRLSLFSYDQPANLICRRLDDLITHCFLNFVCGLEKRAVLSAGLGCRLFVGIVARRAPRVSCWPTCSESFSLTQGTCIYICMCVRVLRKSFSMFSRMCSTARTIRKRAHADVERKAASKASTQRASGRPRRSQPSSRTRAKLRDSLYVCVFVFVCM